MIICIVHSDIARTENRNRDCKMHLSDMHHWLIGNRQAHFWQIEDLEMRLSVDYCRLGVKPWTEAIGCDLLPILEDKKHLAASLKDHKDCSLFCIKASKYDSRNESFCTLARSASLTWKQETSDQCRCYLEELLTEDGEFTIFFPFDKICALYMLTELFIAYCFERLEDRLGDRAHRFLIVDTSVCFHECLSFDSIGSYNKNVAHQLTESLKIVLGKPNACGPRCFACSNETM